MRFRRRTVIREREVTVTEEAHDAPPGTGLTAGQTQPAMVAKLTGVSASLHARYDDPGWQPAVRYDPGPQQGADELDPARHVPVTGPAPVFARLVRHPPVTAPWRAHLGFTADLAARAVWQDAGHTGRPPWRAAEVRPAVIVEVPRTYAELEPDTLAGEFVPLELLP